MAEIRNLSYKHAGSYGRHESVPKAPAGFSVRTDQTLDQQYNACDDQMPELRLTLCRQQRAPSAAAQLKPVGGSIAAYSKTHNNMKVNMPMMKSKVNVCQPAGSKFCRFDDQTFATDQQSESRRLIIQTCTMVAQPRVFVVVDYRDMESHHVVRKKTISPAPKMPIGSMA